MKIKGYDEFVSEKLNIQSVSKDRLNSVPSFVKEEEEWLKKSEADHNTAEYADFITEAYAKAQNDIEKNNYSIEIRTDTSVTVGDEAPLTVRICGTIGYHKKLEYIAEFYVAYMKLYTPSVADPAICFGDNHKLFMGDSMSGAAERAFNEKKLKQLNGLICDDSGLFNDRIKGELDKIYNQNSTWKTNYKDDIVDGIKKEVKDANVSLRVMRKGKEIMPVTLLIGICDKKSGNRFSDAFGFDLRGGKIDGNESPLMYLSPFDRSGNNTYRPNLKYMAMRNAEDLLKECGGKPWRKVIYKNPQDIIVKTLRFVKDCLPLMNLYCGGDVLHGTELKGVLDISIADAYRQSQQKRTHEM